MCKKSNKDCKMHRWPHLDEELYNCWLTRIGNPKLQDMDPKQVNKNYRVCDIHFSNFCKVDSSHKTGRSGLIARSTPTLFLPGFNETPTPENSVLKYVTATEVHEESSLSAGTSIQQDSVNSPDVEMHFPRSDFAPRKQGRGNSPFDLICGLDLHSELSECSTPKRKRSLPLAGNRSPTLGVTPKSRKAVLDTVCDYVICALDLRKRSSFLKTVGVTRKQQLTPKSRKLYHIATALQRTARRLDYENIDLKQRVELADNFIKSEEFMHTVVNDVAAKFIMSQIKLQKMKPRGRRFTLDDKLLALSIMKQSPKGYRFLQKVFALPALMFIQTFALRELVDTGDYDTKMCYKLTDGHVYATHMKKMKVSVAAQIFSHSLSASMRALARLGAVSLPKSCVDTADFLLFVDKLFDSVNGSAIKPPFGKGLYCAITKDSEHLEFWHRALPVLQSIVYVGKGKEFVPPSVSNWITTIRGLMYIWGNLSNSLTFLCPRNFNQDPVENFFGSIRSHVARNVNPTPSFFAASFKSILVNNFMSAHSPGSNCEEDNSEGALDNLRSFLERNVEEAEESATRVDIPTEVCEMEMPEADSIVRNVHAYIAGYMVRKLRKNTNRCTMCISYLSSKEASPDHILIEAREYAPSKLYRANSMFMKTFTQSLHILSNLLPKICYKPNIKQSCKLALQSVVHFPGICDVHNLKDIFTKNVVDFFVHTWIKNINRTLKGLDSKKYLLSNIRNVIAKRAHARYIKYRTRNTKIQQLKKLQT
ncbi:thap domain [Holotrichia oblita]|uniref:Thap domain n=1 Tax=Holotrichia oblita TaxID=644536 RepID=A0ACB9T7X3_HOLOL|nr:thap domain [Holotrichia oblita]